MGALLETVTLADWQAVVTGALQKAKTGDAQARHWLGQYLMGRPESAAPTPLNIVVQQLNGVDPVVSHLAKLAYDREILPHREKKETRQAQIEVFYTSDLTQKMMPLQTTENPALARDSRDSDANSTQQKPSI